MAGIAPFLYSQFSPLPKPTASYTGKTVIVTGSNVGLGKEAARHFAQLGASTLILAVRSLSKGEAAKRDIEASTSISRDVIQVWELDMSSYASVLTFSSRACTLLPRLDTAVLNAGVMNKTWETHESHESTLTINLLSTFLLALSLLPKLVSTATHLSTRPTLTIVTSSVHAWAKFPERYAPTGQIFPSLDTPRDRPDLAERYYVSKLLELLAVRAIAERKSATQMPVTVNCVNPGYCHSEIMRGAEGWGQVIVKAVLARSTEMGSRNLVWAASAGPESHGGYVTDCQVARPSDYVLSGEGWRDQQRVWGELVGILEGVKEGITEGL